MLFQKTQTLAQAMQQGQLPDMPTLQGLFFVSNTIQKEIQFISADPDSAEFVKKSTDYLAQVNNELKALAQRLQQAMKAQQPQADPKVAIEAAKAQQQMAQSAQSHQLSLQSQAQEHALTLQHRQQEHALDTAARVPGSMPAAGPISGRTSSAAPTARLRMSIAVVEHPERIRQSARITMPINVANRDALLMLLPPLSRPQARPY